MSDKKENATRKVRSVRLSSNTNAGSNGRLGLASKTSSAESKQNEESSADAKRTTKGAVSVNQPSKLKTVLGSVWRPRASSVVLPESAPKSSAVKRTAAESATKSPNVSSAAKRAAAESATKSSAVKRTVEESVTKSSSVSSAAERTAAESVTKPSSVSSAVKHTAAEVAQKETRGRKEITQVPRTPTGGKRPVSPATKTSTKTAASQQVWKKKAQPKSSTKEVTVEKQQARPSGSTSNKSTATTKSSPPTDASKQKKSAAQEQVLKEKNLPKDQSSQEKQAKHKASTSKSYLETKIYPAYHIKFDVTEAEEADSEIGVCCCLCEQDLGVAPVESDTENEYPTLPVAAILTCGHVFHNDCLACGELEGQQTEPLCVFCESL